MIIIIPKILFPFSIREFPKNMIGYIRRMTIGAKSRELLELSFL